MRNNHLWIGGIGILALLALPPLISSGVPPASKANKQPTATERVIYSFTGGADGASPASDLILDGPGNLYGTTEGGGTGTACTDGCGTVFELKRTQSGWNEQVLYSFQGGKDGALPGAGLIFDSAGNLYGTTSSNFGSECGTVFKLAPNGKGGWTESVLYSFDCKGSAGLYPSSDLVFDSQGNLYGTASQGGGGKCNVFFGYTCGAVFELTPQSNGSWTESTLHQFAGPPNDGGYPLSGVVLDSAGNVYGMTFAGGTGTCEVRGYLGCGFVYKLTPSHGGWTETQIYVFPRGGGFARNPSSALILDKDGDLAGASQFGGDGFGTVFQLRPSQGKLWDQSVLYRFYGPDGLYPNGKLAMDAQGDLFGVTDQGGTGASFSGTVFELERPKAGRWRERVLHSFVGGNDGAFPSAGPVLDGQGHLYGTTFQGGTGTLCNSNNLGCGTVYEVTP
jgi:uncharacterized repeat protein (TIGR03803 family)